MARTPRDRYESRRSKLDRRAENGTIDTDDHDAITEFLDAKDPNRPVADPADKTKSANTLRNYTGHLTTATGRIQHFDTTLCEASTDDLNRLFYSYRSGDHPDVKDSGLSDGTIFQHQGTIRKFLRYYTGDETDHIPAVDPDRVNADPRGIELFNGTKATTSKVSERDMFTRDDIQAMREVITNPRDRAMFELFLNTGQRISVIQNLRIKDIDLQEGRFWINEDADGRKGAEGQRPLLGAKPAVAEYLDYHPTNEPEDTLITVIPGHSGIEGDPLHQAHIRKTLQNIGKRADVTKPVHPHNFRHGFVTIAKKEYDLPDDTIKFLIGHKPGSDVMETTYSHLTDEDHNERAEIGAGIREPDTDVKKTLTPDSCPTCGAQLGPQDKACSRCGTVFAPDSKAVQESVEATEETRAEAASEGDAETTMIAEKIGQMIEKNPEGVAEALKDADL